MKRFLQIFLAFCFLFGCAAAEDHGSEEIPVYVTADVLNLRSIPSKKGIIVVERENGDMMTATGRWSKDRQWIEILHPEFGYVWCDYHYVTERMEDYTVETLWETPIKIRKSAFTGRVTGYLRRGQTLRITQTVMGWGKTRQGWIDLEYCIEIEE